MNHKCLNCNGNHHSCSSQCNMVKQDLVKRNRFYLNLLITNKKEDRFRHLFEYGTKSEKKKGYTSDDRMSSFEIRLQNLENRVTNAETKHSNTEIELAEIKKEFNEEIKVISEKTDEISEKIDEHQKEILNALKHQQPDNIAYQSPSLPQIPQQQLQQIQMQQTLLHHMLLAPQQPTLNQSHDNNQNRNNLADLNIQHSEKNVISTAFRKIFNLKNN